MLGGRKQKDGAMEMRKLIAGKVSADPAQYNEVFLGKSNGEYCEFILDPDHWGGECPGCVCVLVGYCWYATSPYGSSRISLMNNPRCLSCSGAIELAIFSQHYNVEIASIDIQTLRPLIYGGQSAQQNMQNHMLRTLFIASHVMGLNGFCTRIHVFPRVFHVLDDM